MIFIFCIKGVNWERTPDAAWLMCVDNISDGSWAKHMFCSDIDHHGVDGPAKLVMGWSICPQQHNVDIDVAFFDSSLQHFPAVCQNHSFFFSFLDGDLTAWNRSSPNWKKNNPLGNCYWQLPTPGAGGPQFWWLPKIYHDPSSSNPYTPFPRTNLSF